MEIRKINDTTIRCIITQQDLKENEIDLDDLIEHKPRGIRYLQSIMEEAAEREDFHVNGPFTSMQIRVLKDNSICLTLTQGLQPDLLSALRGLAARLSEMNEHEEAAALPGENSTAEHAGAETDASPGFVYAYIYDSMEEVIGSCRSVPDLASQDSALYYYDEERAYYLMIRPNGSEAGYERALLSMNEFGEFYELTAAETAFIMEHGTCILRERAVQQLLSV